MALFLVIMSVGGIEPHIYGLEDRHTIHYTIRPCVYASAGSRIPILSLGGRNTIHYTTEALLAYDPTGN